MRLAAWNDRTNFDRNLAVVIGIDIYKNNDKISKLSTPVSDANALADLLEKEFGYQNVYRLINDEANLDGLKTLLDETLPNKLKPTESDRLIFYFAGHGLPKNSNEGPTGYLVPQDADISKSDSLLPMSELYDALNKLQCHHLLVVLDCCFAGTFRWASRKAIVELEAIHREHYDRFIRFPAWQLITSSAHDQEALDVVILSKDRRGKVDDQNHSPFALALLEALQDGAFDSQGQRYLNADYTKDRLVRAHGLILYLSDRVSQLSKDHQKPGLYPLTREYDKGEFIFVKPGFDPQQLLPAPELNEENNPYRGLKPFEERHAQFFFGRQKLIKKLSDRLAKSHHPLTVVLGISGSGKSSLVKAGLLPHLRQKQKLEASAQDWYILDPMRPGNSPFAELAKTLLPIANSNLIADLSQVNFLDHTFAEILKSGHQQKPISQSSTSPDSQDRLSSEQALVATIKLAKWWDTATKDQNNAAKLQLVVNYFNKLKYFCDQEQQNQLSDLHCKINNTLDPLTQSLQQNPEHFTDLMTKWSQSNPNTKLLLVIDQFEELVTMNQDNRGRNKQPDSQEQDKEDEWQRFIFLLRNTLAKYRRQLHVVLTLRSDFEPQFLNLHLKKHWKYARFQVQGINSEEGMNSDELREVIEGPALKQALYFEPPELVGKLIDDAGQMPGALPLLSFTLSELYIKLYKRWINDQSTDRALRIKDYEELGGVANALTRRATQEYENLIKEFGKESGKTMRRVMLRMVTIEVGGIARRRVLMDELEYLSSEENDRVVIVIERLVKARLLVKGQETEQPYVEPSHDFLVREWNNLNQWIAEEKESLILQQRLTPAANDWKKDQGNLWTEEDGRLSLLKLVINSDQNWLNKVETNFVNRSIQVKCERLKKQEEQRDEALQGQVSALAALSEARFQDDQLGASIHILKAARILQQLRNSESQWIQEDIYLRTQVVLRQILSKVKEFNRLEDKDIPSSMVTKLSFTCNRAIPLLDSQGRLVKLEFTSDQQLILMQDSRGIIRFWHSDGTLIKRIPPGLSLVKSSSDGHMVAYFIHRTSQPQQEPKANAIRLMNLKGKQVILQKDERDNLMTFTFSRNGQLIASGGWFGELYLWKTDGTIIQQKQTGAGSLNAIDFSPNGDMFVTGSNDGTIRLWNQNGDVLTTIEKAHRDAIWEVSFSPNGETLASVSTDTTVKIWKTNDGTLLTTLNGHRDKVDAVCFNSDGQILASASNDGSVRLWRPNGTKLKGLDGHHTGSVYAVRFNPKQPMIATTSGQGQLILWSQDGRLLRNWEKGHNGTITALDFSPNGRMFVTAAGDREVKVWKLDDDKDKQDFRAHNLGNHTGEIHLPTVFGVSFSSDNQTILLGSGSQDGKGYLELCDSESKLCRIIAEYDFQVLAVCFSPDGQMFALGKGDGSVELWRKEEDNFKLLRNFKQHDNLVLVVCFSPNGNFLATGSADQTVKLWQIDNILNNANSITVTPTKIFPHTDQVTAVRFSPNGDMIATASNDKTVKLWNLDGNLKKTLHGHNDQINALDFSTDGQTLASASNDKIAILWNLELELGLDQLIDYGCEWISGYLTNNPNVSKDNRQVLSPENFPNLKYDSQKWI